MPHEQAPTDVLQGLTEAKPLGTRTPPADPPAEAIAVVAAHLREAARSDPELADACRRLGDWLTGVGDAADAARKVATERGPDAAPDEPVATLIERTLSIGGMAVPVAVRDDGTAPPRESAPAQEAAPQRRVEPTRAPLSVIASRARVKADCCRWAIERRSRMEDGADFDQIIKPTDDALAQRLRALPDCYGWPLDPYVSLPDDRALDDAAGCYDTLADALDLAQRVRADDELLDTHAQRLYQMLAECCSALRAALLVCGVETDRDQDDTFHTLRAWVFDERVYVERHMRLDDPADPAAWPDRREEIQATAAEIERGQASVKEIRNLTGRLGYIAKRWQDYDAAETVVQAQKLVDAVERLVELGLRPSHTSIRDPLLTILDELPADMEFTGPFAEALQYADDFAAQREGQLRPEKIAPPEPTGDVVAARGLLAGKVAVLIGGACRPKAREALREGLGLRELRWITTRPHETITNFEPQVKRDEVAVVMLAIRWASHSFENIKTACDRAGTPYVRLPRGYGVNQVAREIMNQASKAIGARGAD